MRITIVGLCLLMFSALVWAGTFRDDFEDGDLDGWIEYEWPGQDTGEIEEKDGVLVVTDRDSKIDTAAAFNNRQHVSNFTLSVDAKMAQAFEGASTYMEIFFRAAEQGKDWKLAVLNFFGNGDVSLRVWTFIANQAKTVDEVKVPFAFHLGTWYNIKIEMQNRQFTLWIDDKLIQRRDWNGNANLPLAGEIQLGIGGGEANWDNFLCTGPDVPDKGLAIAPQGRLATTWGKLKAF